MNKIHSLRVLVDLTLLIELTELLGHHVQASNEQAGPSSLDDIDDFLEEREEEEDEEEQEADLLDDLTSTLFQNQRQEKKSLTNWQQ